MPESDRDSFISDLHRTAGVDLLRYLTHMLGSRDAAADVAQDAYTRILTQADPVAITHPKAFLFKVAGRLALNHIRLSKRRHFDNVIAFDERDHGIPTRMNPEDEQHRHQELMIAMGAVASMPERTREVFTLHRFKDFSYGEIAEQLDISRKTVEYHMSKGLKHLLFHCDDIVDPD